MLSLKRGNWKGGEFYKSMHYFLPFRGRHEKIEGANHTYTGLSVFSGTVIWDKSSSGAPYMM